MIKKISSFLFVSLLGLSVFLSPSNAKDFEIKEYTFIWHVVKVGQINLKIKKDQDHVVVILSSPGWKVATVSLTPSQAKALSYALAETEDYYNKFRKSDESEHIEVVSAGGVLVTYYSKRNAKNFEVRVHKSKLISSMVIMDKDEALTMSEYLKDSEEMANYVDNLIKP